MGQHRPSHNLLLASSLRARCTFPSTLVPPDLNERAPLRLCISPILPPRAFLLAVAPGRAHPNTLLQAHIAMRSPSPTFAFSFLGQSATQGQEFTMALTVAGFSTRERLRLVVPSCLLPPRIRCRRGCPLGVLGRVLILPTPRTTKVCWAPLSASPSVQAGCRNHRLPCTSGAARLLPTAGGCSQRAPRAHCA